MFAALQYLVWLLTKFLITRRYQIHLHGKEQLKGLKRGVLILPNHPGYIDPVLNLTVFFPYFRPRPMLFEGNFRNVFLYPLMKILNAVQVPDLERPSAQARAQAEKAVAEVIAGLKKGENHIMWPSGRAQRDGVERLGGAAALTEILKAVPEAEVVLVRVRGVWGSSFTYARTGKAPRLLANLRDGFLLILANLLFFMPKRRVDITVERLDRTQLPELKREKVNRWFEAWYNAEGFDPPTFVPYHFLFGPRTYAFPEHAGLGDLDLSVITPETKAAVAEIVEDKLGRPLAESERGPDTTLDQLGLDSLRRMEIALAVEQRFGFTGEQAPQTIGQLWALAQGLVEKAPPKPPPPTWFRPLSNHDAAEIHGATVPEAFVTRALAHPKDVIIADDLAGALTYEKVLVGSLAMANRFTHLPGDNVGLMLPASVACDVAFLGLHLAGKLPVVVNWTTGPASMAHAARLMNLRHVVTSRQFVDRLHLHIDGVEFLFLEDLRKKIGKLKLLRTLLRVRYLPATVRSFLPQPSPDAPAVVLFTSGSEKAPKAVPLTHTNILSNQRAAIAYLGVTRRDSILGFLPMFHSFGMTVTGLLPILAGLRVVHHPDPTDAAALVHKIAAYRTTILVGTPTFVGYIFERAEPGTLDSLRLVVVGAEKCPESLFARARQLVPKATLIEGYGITECAPVVAGNHPDANRPGTIGKPLPGIDVRVVDLETEEPLPVGQMGMLLVSGPNVFPGYIGYDGAPPFVERDGKRWYVTGDLAEIDADGFIHFRGRLKRFIKAGGEMISLPALEEPFATRYPPTKDGPRVAVEGVELEGGRRRIVLFTTEPITLREANAVLEKEGFRGVLRLDEVRRVDAIPVLGTGKTDYKQLRNLVNPNPA